MIVTAPRPSTWIPQKRACTTKATAITIQTNPWRKKKPHYPKISIVPCPPWQNWSIRKWHRPPNERGDLNTLSSSNDIAKYCSTAAPTSTRRWPRCNVVERPWNYSEDRIPPPIRRTDPIPPWSNCCARGMPLIIPWRRRLRCWIKRRAWGPSCEVRVPAYVELPELWHRSRIISRVWIPWLIRFDKRDRGMIRLWVELWQGVFCLYFGICLGRYGDIGMIKTSRCALVELFCHQSSIYWFENVITLLVVKRSFNPGVFYCRPNSRGAMHSTLW